MLHQSAAHVVGTSPIRYRIDLTTSSLASSISLFRERHNGRYGKSGLGAAPSQGGPSWPMRSSSAS